DVEHALEPFPRLLFRGKRAALRLVAGMVDTREGDVPLAGDASEGPRFRSVSHGAHRMVTQSHEQWRQKTCPPTMTPWFLDNLGRNTYADDSVPFAARSDRGQPGSPGAAAGPSQRPTARPARLAPGGGHARLPRRPSHPCLFLFAAAAGRRNGHDHRGSAR